MTELERRALSDAVAALHGGVYAYGVIAAYADQGRRAAVGAALATYQSLRDRVTGALTSTGPSLPAAPAYALPVIVADATSALRLAVTVEEQTARAWRSVLERSMPAVRTVPAGAAPAPVGAGGFDVRGTAVQALTGCALRAAAWRGALSLAPATVAFPGSTDD